ncbi:MAG: tyrosine-type recombinase/integrase [Chloroflexi bacterium]|nr:tyrosine-type recombinase/integrase [Chloroflexota bacterium]
MQSTHQIGMADGPYPIPLPIPAGNAPIAETHQDSEADPTETVLSDFEQYLSSLNITLITIKYYLSILVRFLQWFSQIYSEKLIVEGITPSVVKKYKKSMLNTKNINPNSMKKQMAALSAIIKWAGQRKHIRRDPIKYAMLSEPIHRTHKWLDPVQQTILTGIIESDLKFTRTRYPRRWLTRRRDAVLATFLLQTGLRLIEVIRLQASDIQISKDQGNVSVRYDRNNRNRVVPLNNEARRVLQNWYLVRPQSRFLWTTQNRNHDQPLSGRAVQRILNRYAKDAKIENLTPAVCRHTFARNLVENEVGLEHVAALLGLSSLDAVRFYAAPSEKQLEGATEKAIKVEMA